MMCNLLFKGVLLLWAQDPTAIGREIPGNGFIKERVIVPGFFSREVRQVSTGILFKTVHVNLGADGSSFVVDKRQI